jgi:hypothetical protein
MICPSWLIGHMLVFFFKSSWGRGREEEEGCNFSKLTSKHVHNIPDQKGPDVGHQVSSNVENDGMRMALQRVVGASVMAHQHYCRQRKKRWVFLPKHWGVRCDTHTLICHLEEGDVSKSERGRFSGTKRERNGVQLVMHVTSEDHREKRHRLGNGKYHHNKGAEYLDSHLRSPQILSLPRDGDKGRWSDPRVFLGSASIDCTVFVLPASLSLPIPHSSCSDLPKNSR